MRIETIGVRNFKSLHNIRLRNLPSFCVFVGRNGSGKTTLFRVFAFLKNCLQYDVRVALNREGGRNGYREVVTRGHRGEDIQIEIQLRMDIAEAGPGLPQDSGGEHDRETPRLGEQPLAEPSKLETMAR